MAKKRKLIISILVFCSLCFVDFETIGSDKDLKNNKSLKTSQVEIVAVGDNLYHSAIYEYGVKNDGSRDYRPIYEHIKRDISSADIAVVNQETILGGTEMGLSGFPIFNTPWQAGDALEATGFDILTCATNHSMDKGERGLEKHFEFFQKHPNLMEIGLNKNEDEYNTIDYYTKNGIKFALLNYTYGTNGIAQPSDKPWTVNLLDENKIAKDVTKAKANSDVVIVFPHWGTEYNTGIGERQKKYTKVFSDLGVDIVIGTHPHVIEPVKWILNEETGEKMLVYYSLGNFVSNQPKAIMQLGAMAKIKIKKTGDEVVIADASAVPLVTHVVDYPRYVRVYKLDDYTDELARKNHSHSSVKYFKDKAREILGDFVELKEAS